MLHPGFMYRIHALCPGQDTPFCHVIDPAFDPFDIICSHEGTGPEKIKLLPVKLRTYKGNINSLEHDLSAADHMNDRLVSRSVSSDPYDILRVDPILLKIIF